MILDDDKFYKENKVGGRGWKWMGLGEGLF